MEHLRQEFAGAVAPGDGSLAGELDHAALLIAAAIDPSVSIDAQLERLDRLSDRTDAQTAPELARSLFGGADFDPTRHFAGNQSQYYDIENSLLHRVLDRRIGIPITLSVLLIEVGRRRGIQLQGVGMPGHFLVLSAEGFIDAFGRGILLDEAGCLALFRRLAGPDADMPPGGLAVSPPALTVKRMLVNLAAIAGTGQHRGTLRAVRSLLAAFPDATHREHIQHAFAAAEFGRYDEAARAAERALATVPEQVHDKLQRQIDGWRARLN